MQKQAKKQFQQWSLSACFILLIPTIIFVSNSFWHNFILLPEYKKDGVPTTATVIKIQKLSGERMYGKTIVVEHQPPNANATYRHWLEGYYVNLITTANAKPQHLSSQYLQERLQVGDLLNIIYLPKEPNSRAVLKESFQEKYQAPIKRLSIALPLLGIFLLAVTVYLVARRISLTF